MVAGTVSRKEVKRACFELGAKAAPVVVRFDPRVPGVVLPGFEGEMPPSISLAFLPLCAEKNPPKVSDEGVEQLMLEEAPPDAAKAGEPAPVQEMPNRAFVPWDAVWAIEAHVDAACRVFEESVPVEQVKAVFAHNFSLQDSNRTLIKLLSEAMVMANAAHLGGPWIAWRTVVDAILNPRPERPARTPLQVVPK
jgi:hypothetical protein